MHFYIFYQNIRILLGQVKGLQIWSLPSQMLFDCPAKSSNLSSPNFICQECKFVWYACRKHLQKYLKCILNYGQKVVISKKINIACLEVVFHLQQMRQNFDYIWAFGTCQHFLTDIYSKWLVTYKATKIYIEATEIVHSKYKYFMASWMMLSKFDIFHSI